MNALRQTVLARPRLIASIVLGAVLGLALPVQWAVLTRVLVGWNVTVWLYLVLIGWLMVRASHDKVRQIAEQEDEGAGILLVIMSVAATVSLAAIVLELSTARNLPMGDRLLHYAFTGATVVGSWCLLATLFAFHYARAYYRSPAGGRALRFPDGEVHPDYWDFMYFSYTIAVAAQTSDISVMSRSMRKIVLAQSVLGFFFNVAIIGLSINIAAGMVGA